MDKEKAISLAIRVCETLIKRWEKVDFAHKQIRSSVRDLLEIKSIHDINNLETILHQCNSFWHSCDHKYAPKIFQALRKISREIALVLDDQELFQALQTKKLQDRLEELNILSNPAAADTEPEMNNHNSLVLKPASSLKSSSDIKLESSEEKLSDNKGSDLKEIGARLRERRKKIRNRS